MYIVSILDGCRWLQMAASCSFRCTTKLDHDLTPFFEVEGRRLVGKSRERVQRKKWIGHARIRPSFLSVCCYDALFEPAWYHDRHGDCGGYPVEAADTLFVHPPLPAGKPAA